MFAIVDLKDRSIVNANVSLPFRKELPDGGVTVFEREGQAEPGHKPRFKAVAVKDASEKPAYPVSEVSTERVYDGRNVVVTRTYAPDLSAFQRAIEDRVEAVAMERSYSSAVSLASYISSSIPQWQAEARAFVEWRDALWSHALTELAKAQSAQRGVPTIDEFFAELPQMTWPEFK